MHSGEGGGDFSDTEVFSPLNAPLGHQNAFAPLAKNRADPCLNDWGWGEICPVTCKNLGMFI